MLNYHLNSKINFKLLFFLILLIFQNSFAQETRVKDSLENSLKIKQFIIPATFIATGFVLLNNTKLNQNIKNNIQEHNPNFHTSIDNYSQFVPGAAVFVLNAFGVKGKHHWKDAGLIYTGSIAIASAFFYL